MRGANISEMIDRLNIPNLQVFRTREGPCYQFRGRGCLPVHLDGARLGPASVSTIPLEMLSTVGGSSEFGSAICPNTSTFGGVCACNGAAAPIVATAIMVANRFRMLPPCRAL
jgi:hypothetical protein